MVKLFVYGTLKRGCSNDHMLRKAKYICDATLDDHFALYNTPYGFPAVKRTYENSKPFYGEVFEIPEDMLPALDYFEGYPDLYDRTEVTVKNGTELHNCIIYVGNDVKIVDTAITQFM